MLRSCFFLTDMNIPFQLFLIQKIYYFFSLHFLIDVEREYIGSIAVIVSGIFSSLDTFIHLFINLIWNLFIYILFFNQIMQNIPKSQRTDGWSGDLTKGNK